MIAIDPMLDTLNESPNPKSSSLPVLGCLSILVLFSLLVFTEKINADIYVRTHPGGFKEFTNCPAGSGWMFHMKETGDEIIIEFYAQGKPKSIEEIVEEIAEKYEIESSLVKAIIMAESNCNPAAVSKKGAQGLMQLMPSTAKSMNVSKPLDPRENIIGGVKYIKGLVASYGDLKLALAAYNAGPGVVKKYAGIPPYRETQNYIEKVMQLYTKFRYDPSFKLAGEQQNRN
jgi:hypothetical protein